MNIFIAFSMALAAFRLGQLLFRNHASIHQVIILIAWIFWASFWLWSKNIDVIILDNQESIKRFYYYESPNHWHI